MQKRHVRLLVIMAMTLAAVVFLGLYLFISIHFRQFWALFINLGCFFWVFMSSALCYGFEHHMDAESLVFHKSMSEKMTAETYLNYRDLGYVASVTFYLLSFVIPVVPWYMGSFRVSGVLLTHVGNFLFSVAFVGAVEIFLLKRGGGGR